MNVPESPLIGKASQAAWISETVFERHWRRLLNCMEDGLLRVDVLLLEVETLEYRGLPNSKTP
jgi:hypothetical protein